MKIELYGKTYELKKTAKPDGRKRVQYATVADLRPNNVLLDALCKSLQESDK